MNQIFIFYFLCFMFFEIFCYILSQQKVGQVFERVNTSLILYSIVSYIVIFLRDLSKLIGSYRTLHNHIRRNHKIMLDLPRRSLKNIIHRIRKRLYKLWRRVISWRTHTLLMLIIYRRTHLSLWTHGYLLRDVSLWWVELW